MRLRSDIWVAAYLRRVAVEGAVAVLRRRGAARRARSTSRSIGSTGRVALFEPAPQSEVADRGVERLWARAHKAEWVEVDFVEARMAREIAFDPDLWLIEVEDRAGRCWLDFAA